MGVGWETGVVERVTGSGFQQTYDVPPCGYCSLPVMEIAVFSSPNVDTARRDGASYEWFTHATGLPCSWQGWAVYICFFAVVVVSSVVFHRFFPVHDRAEAARFRNTYLADNIANIIALIYICRKTTPGGIRWWRSKRSSPTTPTHAPHISPCDAQTLAVRGCGAHVV